VCMRKAEDDYADKVVERGKLLTVEVKEIDSSLIPVVRDYNKLMESKAALSSAKIQINQKTSALEKLMLGKNTDVKKESELLDINKEKASELSRTKNEASSIAAGLEFITESLRPKSDFRSFVVAKSLGLLNQLIKNTVDITIPGSELSLTEESGGISLSFRRDKKEIPIKNLSGGEKRRMDLAILLSMQRYLVTYSQVSLNCIVLDEIFDSLDGVGIDNFIKALTYIFDESSSIFLISHNESLKNLISDQIKIVKENGKSILIS